MENTNTASKKKITAVAAVVLALALLVGGGYIRLSAS